MPAMDRGTCRSCRAPIYWVPTEKTGKLMPLDVAAEKRIVVLTSGEARVVDCYVSHFSTCPSRDLHRKPRT